MPNPPQRPWQTRGRSVDYAQVLITGERGNLRFVDGHYDGVADDAEERFFMSLVWYELQFASDEELKGLRTWDEAQAYLSIIAAGRPREGLVGDGGYLTVRPGELVISAVGPPDETGKNYQNGTRTCHV